MHIGQPAVDAVVADGELGVADSQEVQDGGVDIVDFGRALAVERLVAKLVAGAVGDSTAVNISGFSVKPLSLFTNRMIIYCKRRDIKNMHIIN
jgi:hypothetical protein